MAVIHIDEEYGCNLSFSNNKFIVKKDSEELQNVFLFDCDAIIINNNSSISSCAVNSILENDIPAYFISNTKGYLGKIQKNDGKNIFLRKRQYILSEDTEFCFDLQKAVVLGKLKNQKTMLQRCRRYHNNKKLDNNIYHLTSVIKGLQNAETDEKVMAYEGVGSHIYFNGFGKMLKSPFVFNSRSRRPPKDPVNAMLGYLYAMLAGYIEKGICVHGLDSFCGFLHTDTYGRESLVYDLMEEFRPIICDSVVLFMCNTGMVDFSDFEEKNNGLYLNKKGRKKVIECFYKRIRTEIKYNGQTITYEKLFDRKAGEFASCLIDTTKTYEPYLVR